MPFHLGQVFNWIEHGDERQVLVLRIRNGGQEAFLRYVDTRVEEWVEWSEFQKSGKWKWVGGER